jgi:hypothetical protein
MIDFKKGEGGNRQLWKVGLKIYASFYAFDAPAE